MSLTPGVCLGPYEILSAIGAGGMGEVYRARDTRLDRVSAVKVLPEHVAADPQFRERFDREARAISQLEHPHICALYDVGEAPNPETPGEPIRFLVMQYLEGDTLADRLAKGPLPLNQALQFAIQLADALHKAHRHGVVHRDLKPGNIMLTKSGAKLLDFGLAKTAASNTASAGLSMLPTTPPTLTAHGTILGTFQYMAPEQLEGGEADARTDIFAFGVVLYEMLTGKQAFTGKSRASLIGAILKDHPPPISSLEALTPRVIDHIVGRCLEKDPEDRWQTASDLMRELEWAATSLTQTTAPGVDRRRLWRPVTGVIAIAALVSVVVGFAVWRRQTGPAPPIRRFAIALPDGQQFTAPGGRRFAVLSPDGNYLVYIANQRLHLRAMDRLETTPIEGTQLARDPFFSPDSQWIGFIHGDQLKKIAVAGGPAVPLGHVPVAFGVSWGPQDTILFGRGTDGIWRIPAAGGQPSRVLAVDAKKREAAISPQMLPGGNAVMFTLTSDGQQLEDNRSQIVVQSLGSLERKVVVQGGADARYVSTGHLVYARAGTLVAAPFDRRRLIVTGNPVPLVERVLQGTFGGLSAGGSGFAAQFTISDDGLLAYVPQGALLKRTLVWVDRQGNETPISVPERAYIYPRISPDGTRVALDIRDEDQDIHIWDLARETLTRLTFEPGADIGPQWTPDGRRIAFHSMQQGLVWRLADGTGSTERLTGENTNLQTPSSFTPDGMRLILNEQSTGQDYAVTMLSLDDKREAQPLLQTRFNEMNATVSPDGRWLAYQSNESGPPEIYVRPFPDVQTGRWQLSTSGGTRPLWARTGRELFYVALGGAVMSAAVDTAGGFRPANPTKLFSGLYYMGLIGRTYDVSADGQKFLMIKNVGHTAAEAPRILIVENWFEELKRRVRATSN